MPGNVLRVCNAPPGALADLLSRYRLNLVMQDNGSQIRGSFWGEAEAGIIGNNVFARDDTPIHSLLHETSHIVCMNSERRVCLDRDAGSEDLEESAVCYMQIVLADFVDGVGRVRLMSDMDTWGYSFRLGNTRDWFEQDSGDAAEFLLNHGLLNECGEPTFQLRG